VSKDDVRISVLGVAEGIDTIIMSRRSSGQLLACMSLIAKHTTAVDHRLGKSKMNYGTGSPASEDRVHWGLWLDQWYSALLVLAASLPHSLLNQSRWSISIMRRSVFSQRRTRQLRIPHSFEKSSVRFRS
jgi:hypothetical protein